MSRKLSQLFHARPSAAKWGSAAASRFQAMAQSNSVTSTVTAPTAVPRSLRRCCPTLRTPAQTVPIRRKKFPKGSTTKPVRPSRKQRLPLYPWASMPHRASTNQTAKICHTSGCQLPSTGCSPQNAIAPASTSQQPAQRGVSAAARRWSARAMASTPATNSTVKTGRPQPANRRANRISFTYR